MNKLFLSVLLLALLTIVGCKDMDSTYKEFIVPGGLVYVGKPTSVVGHPGKNRAMLSWVKGTDPNISKSRIYWNNYTDSLEVTMEQNVDTVKVIIPNLLEQTYTFNIKAFDNEGNSSVPVEVIARVYGNNYQNTLLNRGLNRTEINNDGLITFQWAPANVTAGAYQTEVHYTDSTGTEQKAAFDAKLTSNSLADFKAGNAVKFRTIYLPNQFAIDTFYTEFDSPSKLFLVKKDWKIVDFSSEHPGGDNTVRNFIDGTAGTRWHSLVAGGQSYPHHATIDLGKTQNITEVGVWRTTFENGGDVRAPTRIAFAVSNDNKKWTSLGEFDFNRMLNGEQLYALDSVPPARYLKFIGLQGPEYYIVMGEIDVYVK